jgi:hypothetical protein
MAADEAEHDDGHITDYRNLCIPGTYSSAGETPTSADLFG